MINQLSGDKKKLPFGKKAQNQHLYYETFTFVPLINLFLGQN
jgi:hypothetical protein